MERRAIILITMLCVGCSKTSTSTGSSASVDAKNPEATISSKAPRDSRERKLTLRGKPFRRSFDDVTKPLETQLGFGFVGSMNGPEPFLKGQKGGWGTGLGPVVFLSGDDEGLKYVDFSFYERTDDDNLKLFVQTINIVINSLCNDSTMVCQGSPLQQREIEAERERILKWITGPAIAALHAAESKTRKHRLGEHLQTSVRAVFDGIVMRGQITPEEKGPASFTFRFTPGPCTTDDWSADE